MGRKGVYEDFLHGKEKKKIFFCGMKGDTNILLTCCISVNIIRLCYYYHYIILLYSYYYIKNIL